MSCKKNNWKITRTGLKNTILTKPTIYMSFYLCSYSFELSHKSLDHDKPNKFNYIRPWQQFQLLSARINTPFEEQQISTHKFSYLNHNTDISIIKNNMNTKPMTRINNTFQTIKEENGPTHIYKSWSSHDIVAIIGKKILTRERIFSYHFTYHKYNVITKLAFLPDKIKKNCDK